VGQGQQVLGESAKAPHWVWVPVWWHRYINGGGTDVDARSTWVEHWCSRRGAGLGLSFLGRANLQSRTNPEVSQADGPGEPTRSKLLSGITALLQASPDSATNDLLTGPGTRLINGLVQKHHAPLGL
jgi:hypothetical protein